MKDVAIDDIVRNFRDFLERSWGNAVRVFPPADSGFEDFEDDWCQANWETLVECAICETPVEILEFYGDGAECNGPSGRVWLPSALATHRVRCLPKAAGKVLDVLSGEKIALPEHTFERFVSWNGRTYSVSPPFDYVLLESVDDIAVVSTRDVRFDIEELCGDES